jgi:hypothetical protein
MVCIAALRLMMSGPAMLLVVPGVAGDVLPGAIGLIQSLTTKRPEGLRLPRCCRLQQAFSPAGSSGWPEPKILYQ